MSKIKQYFICKKRIKFLYFWLDLKENILFIVYNLKLTR